jgi:hypothetical protein
LVASADAVIAAWKEKEALVTSSSAQLENHSHYIIKMVVGILSQASLWCLSLFGGTNKDDVALSANPREILQTKSNFTYLKVKSLIPQTRSFADPDEVISHHYSRFQYIHNAIEKQTHLRSPIKRRRV